jgi:uncharacterized protein YsxB (DUF464 family)
MIEVAAVVGPGTTEIRVTGHESHDGDTDRRGIVCAAVTAVTRTALMGLEQFGQMYPDQVQVTVNDLHQKEETP